MDDEHRHPRGDLACLRRALAIELAGTLEALRVPTDGDASMNIPTPLRAITLHPWWAYAITHGDKRIEYRTRPLPAHLVDVPIALHAGAATPADRRGTSERVLAAEDLGAPITAWRVDGCPSSAFVAVVVFSGTIPTVLLPLAVLQLAALQCRPPLVGWQIRSVSRLSTPRPAAGKQGWWTCTDEQREAIAGSLAVGRLTSWLRDRESAILAGIRGVA